LKIILYEPFGCGGICHYTYQLAQSLAISGIDVTVVTQKNYELNYLNKLFKVNYMLGCSWTKSFIKGTLNRIKINSNKNDDIVNNHNNTKIINPSTENSYLLTIRRWIIWLEVIVYFLVKRPNVIHFQWLLYPKEDYYFLIALKLLRFNIVFTAHNLLPHDDYLMHEKETFQKLYRLADKVIVHTENNKMEMVNQFVLKPQKIDIIPHGIYDMFFLKNVLTQKEARKKLDIPEEKNVILFFGSIKRYKGLEYLIESFREVRGQTNDALLLIVGKVGGDEEETIYYTNLLTQLQEFHDIKCVNKYIPFDEVALYFAASNLVVLPYLKTYQSGILLLSYAAGRPVIVTETGGLSETVENGKSGFIVPSKDAKSLAQALVRMIENPAQTREMGRYGNILADTKYSWKNIAAKTIEVYQVL